MPAPNEQQHKPSGPRTLTFVRVEAAPMLQTREGAKQRLLKHALFCSTTTVSAAPVTITRHLESSGPRGLRFARESPAPNLSSSAQKKPKLLSVGCFADESRVRAAPFIAPRVARVRPTQPSSGPRTLYFEAAQEQPAPSLQNREAKKTPLLWVALFSPTTKTGDTPIFAKSTPLIEEQLPSGDPYRDERRVSAPAPIRSSQPQESTQRPEGNDAPRRSTQKPRANVVLAILLVGLGILAFLYFWNRLTTSSAEVPFTPTGEVLKR